MKKLILILAVLLFVPAIAAADVFYLDEVNTNNTGTLGPWAKITLTDTSAGGLDGVHFLVEPLAKGFASLGPNFGMQAFYFNEATDYGKDLIVKMINPESWKISYSKDAGGGFGKFEFLTAGTGSTRATDKSPLVFDVFAPTGKSITIGDLSTVLSSEGYIFAAHIADYNGGNSAKFATDGPPSKVPEPGTLVLLGTGLVGLAGYSRKRLLG